METSARASRLGLVVAAVMFAMVGLAQTEAFGTWHEELSVHPNIGYRVLEGGGEAPMTFAPHCGPDHTETLVFSPARPRLTACLGERGFPVMVESYIGGVLYWPGALLWPVHQGNAYRLRKLGLVVGVLGLLLTYLLVSRLRDEPTAAVVALIVSVSSPFVYLHSLLVYYEVVPFMCLTGALLLVGPRGPTVEPRRMIGAGLLLGLGTLANVKMVLLVAPLAVLVLLRHRRWLRALDARAWTGSALAALLGAAPLIWFSLVDPSRGFGDQVERRLGTFLEHLQAARFFAELGNLASFGADVGALLESRFASWWLMAPFILSGGWAVYHLVRYLRGLPADVLGVLSGALLGSYLFVSMLLYDQVPHAAYSPVSTVFGMALGGAVMAGARAASRWWAHPGAPAPAVVAVWFALLLDASSVIGLATRMRGADVDDRPVNVHAQRALGTYLRATPDERTLVVTTYTLAGVVESLSDGQRRAVQAHAVLHECLHEEDASIAETCLDARLDEVLDFVGDDVAVLAPTHGMVTDEPHAARIVPALERVAAARGLAMDEEAHFDTADGVEIFTLRVLSR